MKNSFNYPLFYFLQFTWGIIQNIIGFFLYIALLISNPKRFRGKFLGTRVITWNRLDSASIGIFIFLSNRDRNFKRVLVHEFGHCIQSCILGPFYLLFIGIPSLIWCHYPSFKLNRARGKYRYSSFYTERWANSLAQEITGLPTINH